MNYNLLSAVFSYISITYALAVAKNVAFLIEKSSQNSYSSITEAMLSSLLEQLLMLIKMKEHPDPYGVRTTCGSEASSSLWTCLLHTEAARSSGVQDDTGV